ncbi:hypothetical protein QT970_24745 [Microcoleus sp. herbarium8]
MGIPGEKTKFFIMSQPGLTAGAQGRLDATGCDLRAIQIAPVQTKPMPSGLKKFRSRRRG